MAFDRSTITILVVEDEPLPRLDLADELKGGGYEVREAGSAEEALIHLSNGHRIDIVITDIALGGELTGWDVAEKFRAARLETPIIYVSGMAGDQRRRVPGSIFFAKPYRALDILNVCHRLSGPDRPGELEPSRGVDLPRIA